MSLAYDLGPVGPAEAVLPASPPHNIEAEQALLGALLFDNAAYERLGDQLARATFTSRSTVGSTA
jgi:replicative DNA helicase